MTTQAIEGGAACAKARLCGYRMRDSAERSVKLVEMIEAQGGSFTAKEIARIDEVEDAAAKLEEFLAEKAGAVIPE